MKVRLISYSQPHLPETTLDAQDLISYCARVSNPSNQNNVETSERLLTYLAKEKHWSPFEMVSACLEITTTRDIARQILRHRSFSFQEYSQRYAKATDNFSIRKARIQDSKNRQNSIELENMMGRVERADLELDWIKHQSEVMIAARNAYEWALENNIAKEQARAVLPEGMTESTMYMNGTLRSWMHYIELRSGNGTQKEHRDIAIECGKVLSPIFPIMEKFIN